jgi:lactoylglutathione lyase
MSQMKLGYVIIYVEDVVQTLDFYQAAFGFEIRMKFEQDGMVDYGELETGGAILGFANHQLGSSHFAGGYEKVSPEGRPFGQELAFVTDDVEAAFQRAVTAGAVALAEPIQKPWGQQVAYVRAAEGTLIELCSPVGTSAS